MGKISQLVDGPQDTISAEGIILPADNLICRGQGKKAAAAFRALVLDVFPALYQLQQGKYRLFRLQLHQRMGDSLSYIAGTILPFPVQRLDKGRSYLRFVLRKFRELLRGAPGLPVLRAF